jgi:hypothetical protein
VEHVLTEATLTLTLTLGVALTLALTLALILALTPGADVEHVLTEVTNIVLGVMMGGGLTLEPEP